MVHTEDRVDPVEDLEIIHHELRLKDIERMQVSYHLASCCSPRCVLLEQISLYVVFRCSHPCQSPLRKLRCKFFACGLVRHRGRLCMAGSCWDHATPSCLHCPPMQTHLESISKIRGRAPNKDEKEQIEITEKVLAVLNSGKDVRYETTGMPATTMPSLPWKTVQEQMSMATPCVRI